MARRGGCGDGEAGISLVETLAILGLMALAAFLAGPSLGFGTSPTRLAAIASDMAAALTETRTAAIAGSGTATAVLDPGRRLLAGTRRIVLPDNVEMEVLAAGSCPRDAGTVGVTFTATGRSCGAVIRLSRGPKAFRIRVDWYSGHVEILHG